MKSNTTFCACAVVITWNSKTGPTPIRKVFGNVRQRHWSMQPAIRVNLRTNYQRNGRLGRCTDGCVGRKTVGNLQKEWQQTGDLGKNNSKKLGKPPGNQSEQTTQSRGMATPEQGTPNQRQIVTTRVGGRCSELSSLWDMSRNSGAHVFSLSGNKSSVCFLVCTGEQVTNRNGASNNKTHMCRHDHWNGPAKKRDDKHARINAFILNMGSKK